MNPLRVALTVLDHVGDLPLPRRQSDAAAGFDIAAAVPVDAPLTILPGRRKMVPTGIAIALPQGFEAQVRPRSGLAARHGVTVLNAPGTIDADYRGEIKVILINLGDAPFFVERGMRIAQLVVGRVAEVAFDVVSTLPASGRGTDGFGSTGI